MLAYQMLQEEEQGLSLTDVHMKSTFYPVNGEKILKTFKTHVGAMGDGLQQQHIPKGNIFHEKSESVTQSS
jgi:hypothetical protein